MKTEPYIPQHTRSAIDRYVEDGIRTGDFLYCVLTNDLIGAVAHADSQNTIYLANVAKFLWNYAPSNCWGSKENVANWLQAHKEKTESAKADAQHYKAQTKDIICC